MKNWSVLWRWIGTHTLLAYIFSLVSALTTSAVLGAFTVWYRETYGAYLPVMTEQMLFLIPGVVLLAGLIAAFLAGLNEEGGL